MTRVSTKPRIVVLNTRAANVHSVEKALRKIGSEPIVTSNPAEIACADALVLPGVGTNDAVMGALNTMGMSEPVIKFAASGKPLLCICVGLQVLFDSSEEGELPGLGLIKGKVRLIPSGMKNGMGGTLKVPHTGWNEVRVTVDDSERNPIVEGIPQGSYFYFVHSYHCVPDTETDIVATTSYGIEICAVAAHGNVFGTQFHPEKSGDIGLHISKNFLQIVSAI